MKSPENRHRGDVDQIMRFLAEERLSNHVNPYLRRLSTQGALGEILSVHLEQKEEFNHSKIYLIVGKRMMASVEHPERNIGLSPLEFKYMNLLGHNTDELVSIGEIATQVWGRADAQSTIRLYAAYLRRKLGQIGLDPTMIQNKWGEGYILLDKGFKEESREA